MIALLLNPWLWLAAAIALAAGLGGAELHGYERGSDAVRAEWDADRVRLQLEVAKANQAAQAAAAQYEQLRTTQHDRVITVTRKVNDALQTAPIWRDAPLPDGVRDALAGAAGDLAAAEPDRTVPEVPGAADENKRRSRWGLRGGAGLGQRMPGAP